MSDNIGCTISHAHETAKATVLKIAHSQHFKAFKTLHFCVHSE